MNDSVIAANKIKKEYILKKHLLTRKVLSSFSALKGVSITIQLKKTLGIVGESGSGKSTLGEIIGDLQKPSSGEVLYYGQDISKMSKAEYANYRRNVQFIFQDPKGSMNPYMKIKDIIAEPLKILKLCNTEEEIEINTKNIMERVGLGSTYRGRYPSELSGGQCQRVAIARALTVKPGVIVCDEPVSALDVSMQAQILNLLKDLQEEFGTAYLFISHDIGVVNYMADDIAVLYKGTIVEKGKAEDILSKPKDRYTTKLLQSSAFFRKN